MQSILIISSERTQRETLTVQLCDNYLIDQLDRTIVRTETSIGIGEIRKLQQATQLKPFKSALKAAILYDVHKMTIEAQNAFLKTLEEPPDNTYIILTTESSEPLLPTILSRCNIITLEETKRNITNEEKEVIKHQIESITSQGIGYKLYLAQQQGENKEKALAWLEQVILHMRNELLDRYSDTKPVDMYIRLLDEFQETYRIIKTTNVSPRLVLENAFLSI